MYSFSELCCKRLHWPGVLLNISQIRRISSSEIATALRPFYFAVHPDLFGRHPHQRAVNEESLKQLSAHLENLTKQRLNYSSAKVLNFYIRDSSANDRDSFKLIKVVLEQGKQEPKTIIEKLLQSCNLSTDYIKTVKNQTSFHSQKSAFTSSAAPYSTDLRNDPIFGDINYGTEFNNFEFTFTNIKTNTKKTLQNFMQENIDLARLRNEDLEELKEDVAKLQTILVQQLNLKDIRYDCGWNYEHYRGCMKTLQRLAKMHEKHMQVLKGRIVVFAPFTGVSLEGHIMLFTGDVMNNWLDFIKNIPKQDSFLKKIPSYEFALSQVLRNINISRRKFMPKQQAVEYAGYLNKVTTSLGDYLSKNKFPKSWPNSLNEYEIVIESEAGPVMVSPTGQFIIPATYPGFLLVDFITNSMVEAKDKIVKYNQNKHIERTLHKRCIDEMQLKSLTKDDTVTPDKMIATLNKLLTIDFESFRDIHLNISNYYSVLADGTVCIPWDFTPK